MDYETSTEKAIGIVTAQGQFTPSRRMAAARKMHVIARSVYGLDQDWFDRIIARIYAIYPDFCPTQPRLYSIAARLLGLKGAERIAYQVRNVRRSLKSLRH